MNRDDVIRMAREVWGQTAVLPFADLERFAVLVAAHEREECARVCEETTAAWTQHLYNSGCMDCAVAIRARGE